MKKWTIASGLLIISAFAIYFVSQKEDKRTQQEAFILQELQANKTSIIHDKNGGGKVFGMPAAASLQEYYQVFDPVEKRVPQERLAQANKQMQTLLTTNDTRDVEMTWENISSDMGGRTKTLMWDPNQTNKVWAGAATGGIWYNDDITSNTSDWHLASEFLPCMSISSLCYDPNNTQTFYAGTGEASTAIITYRESSGRGAGLYRSTDAGNTWSLMESTKNFPYITDVVVRNESGTSVLYVAVVSGKYQGQDYTTDADAGLYRSADAGSSWEQVLPNISGSNVPYSPTDIAVGADGRLYIGTTRNIAGEGGGTILYSDAGTVGSWTVYDDIKTQIENSSGQYNLPGRVMIGTAPSDANIVYAIIGAGYIDNADSFPYYRGNFILKSIDKGATWQELYLPDEDESWASLSWHAFAIDVNPNNPDHFYIGGLDEYHSKDGGNFYYHVSDWAAMYNGGGNNYIHADQHCIKFQPGSSDKIIFASDGGVFYTSTGSNNYPVFQQRNKNFSSLQFYSCALHPSEDKYLGGLQDNGTILCDNNGAFGIHNMIYGGDGAYCFFYKESPEYLWASYYYNGYALFKNGIMQNWFNDRSGTFVNPAALSASTNNMYNNKVGLLGENANKLWVISEFGDDEWNVNLGTSGTAWFTHITASPHTNAGHDNLFIGNLVGKLYKIEEAQTSNPTTTEIGSPNFPVGAISGIAVGGSEDTLLVTFSNYGVSSIWQTYDGGTTWQEKEGDLPDMPVRWVIYQPNDTKQAMIATELGIWICTNLDTETPHWRPSPRGMGNVRVDMLQIRNSDNKVLAASHGRGLFTTTYYPQTEGLEDMALQDIRINVYPNPCQGIFTLESGLNQGQVQIVDLQGKVHKSLEITNTKQSINVSDLAAGVYLLQVYNENDKTITGRKIIIDDK